LRQEDLVDEIQVVYALGDQVVDLREQDGQVTATILVAKIDLGAEATIVGAAARCFDLGAETGLRVVEAMVVMAVADASSQRCFQFGSRRAKESAGTCFFTAIHSLPP